MRYLAASLIAVLMALPLPAAAQWTVTTADFESFETAELRMDSAGVTVSGGADSSAPRTLSWDQFLQASRHGAEPAADPAAAWMVRLSGGEVAAGRPVATSGEQITWANPLIGEWTVPLKLVRSIERAGAKEAPPTAGAASADLVRLGNDDTISGVVTAIDAQALTITLPAGEAVTIPLESVASVALAATGAAPAAPQRALRVGLGDGSVLTASQLSLDDQSATLVIGGVERRVPGPALLSVEQIGGPVLWLSSVAPVESSHVPFLDSSFPAQMDRSVDGEPIRYDGRTFTRGIGVHSRSKLTWALDGRYRTFRTRYAIAGDLPYANVTVRISLDGKVVHEQADVVTGTLSPVITIGLGQAKSLTLEVDYGKGYDVQDRLNWIEPALMR